MDIDIEKCWIWTGPSRKDDGRAMASRQYAYRLVYESVTGGPCPPGSAHHKCENPSCVNPTHLEFVTQTEHMRQHGWGGDSGQAAKTHCAQGHPYDDENTYRLPNGHRVCRACRRENKRRAKARASNY